MEDPASLPMKENADVANRSEATPLSPGSPDSKGKGRMSWLKTKFSRRLSRSHKGDLGEKEAAKEKGFVGGAALTGASATNSTASLGVAHRDSITTSAKGKESKNVPAVETSLETNDDERIGRPARREEEVSPISPVDQAEMDIPEVKPAKANDDEEFQEARDNFDEGLAPPPTFPAEKSSSPARETKFTEAID